MLNAVGLHHWIIIMAPGGRGRGRSTIALVEPPSAQDSTTHEDPIPNEIASRTLNGAPMTGANSTFEPNSNESGSTSKKKVRGRTRGIATDILIKSFGGSKIPVQWDSMHYKPIGRTVTFLANEIVFVIRNFAPLKVGKWENVEEKEKTSMIDRVLSKFELDITNSAVVSYLHTSMSSRYSGFRNTLKKHFSKFSNIEEANKNKPSDVEKDEDWKFLCSFFSTEEHKRKSDACSTSRSNAKYVHRGGTKSFVQYLYEDREGNAYEMPKGQIEVFYDTHWTKDNGWISEEAESDYKEMIELQKSSEDSDEASICQKVLGKRSGYVKGLGTRPLKSLCRQNFDLENKKLQTEIVDLKKLVQGLVSEMATMKATLLLDKDVAPEEDVPEGSSALSTQVA